jgi:hypothetical protein
LTLQPGGRLDKRINARLGITSSIFNRSEYRPSLLEFWIVESSKSFGEIDLCDYEASLIEYRLVWRGIVVTKEIEDPNVYFRSFTPCPRWKARKRSSTLQNDTSLSSVPNMKPTWRRRRHPGECILRYRQGELVFLRAYMPSTFCYLNGQRSR